jgi:hypothetical protein
MDWWEEAIHTEFPICLVKEKRFKGNERSPKY